MIKFSEDDYRGINCYRFDITKDNGQSSRMIDDILDSCFAQFGDITRSWKNGRWYFVKMTYEHCVIYFKTNDDALRFKLGLTIPIH